MALRRQTNTTLDGRYTLGDVIGAGGMGRVYRGVQHSMDRNVAIKVIDTDETRSKDAVRRFLREAKLASRLNHPNIVPVYDFGQTDQGLLYLVMEYVDGVTLNQVIEGGPLSLNRAVALALQICDALEAAHAESIVHRDLKPANIMVATSPSGREFVRLLDFGIARSLRGHQDQITQNRTLVGTPAYMAPEAALTDEFDERSDVYSLGVILYEMVSGRLPHGDIDNVALLLQRAVHGEPDPLPEEIPPAPANVIMRLLCKNPDDRYADAATAREALEASASASSDLIITSPPAPTRRIPPTGTAELPAELVRPRRGRRIAALSAIGVVLIVAALLLARLWPEPAEGPDDVEGALEEAAQEALLKMEAQDE